MPGNRVEDLVRTLAPQVLAVLARRSGDFGAAEDAVQEALIAAVQHWPSSGVPENPRGWLLQTASRRLIDLFRSDQARRRREDTVAAEPPAAEVPDRDDTLTLLFLCGHPSLTPASAIALTLRAVGGLTTAEIASAFLVPETTMAQRISRAKAKIKKSGEPFRMPAAEERAARLGSVLHVLYLVFNEGYTSSAGGSLHRTELSTEAIRLARLLYTTLPDDGEVAGLLALMLLTDARRPARTGPDGDLVPLADQDRARWDRSLIREGVALVTEALSHGGAGEYRLQAAIAATHDIALRADDTDWPRVLALYGRLEALTGNPMVTLNRAIATAMVHGPSAGLEVLAPLDDRLPGHHRLAAARAHLLELSGSRAEAIRHYDTAAARTANTAEQRYLTLRAARLRMGDSTLRSPNGTE
ncbi:RNA polymerase sigma factor [Amycolatopsis jejuensis]|uniref:RNA polymerase sigma factor n=1 Tax=Amycolatopsis jejuensis TaxID=330084 RepID=UPI0005257A15|nr:sigma-70 family RNA polymerase sigma factor [Amycolatopsis jejuensis]